MSADSTDFVMVKQNKSKKEPLFGRGTTVSKRVASDMLVAEKTVNPNGVYAKNHQKWFDKNVRAKKIADEIGCSNDEHIVKYVLDKDAIETRIDGTSYNETKLTEEEIRIKENNGLPTTAILNTKTLSGVTYATMARTLKITTFCD